MNLNNVFYGFTKDGKYRLLWKKFKTICTSMGDVTTVVYYDLNSKEEFDNSLVDIASLRPITKIVGEKKWMRRKKVKSVFSADESMLIDVSGAFYGEIIEKIKTNGYRKNIELKQNVLFARVNDPEGRSMEVETGYLYPRAEKALKGVCVRETRPIKINHFNNVVEPKRKLLELNYRREL